MIKISFSEADIEALRYWRIQHPDPRVKMRKPTPVRQFLKALVMKPREDGMIPAKADVGAQEAFKKTG